jgi:hypothetical protein
MLGYIVDNLGVDVLIGTEDRKARTVGGAVDSAANASVAAMD